MHMCRSRAMVAALATTASLIAVQPADAASRPDPSPGAAMQPSATARSAGVTPYGGGYAGWSLKAQDAGPQQPPASTPFGPRATGRMSPDKMSIGPHDRPWQVITGPATPFQVTRVHGIDVSAYQGEVDWRDYALRGYRFAYVKATEGTYYRSDDFSAQFSGAKAAGLKRGAYHFANPSTSSGVSQANYFVEHGGDWPDDGDTLPGMVDLEASPYGKYCYGKTPRQMVAWITAFTDEYRRLTGRDAVIYTSNTWWSRCTDNTTKFNRTNPLWIARWASTPGELPGGWPYHTFWQYTSTPVDQDWFNGSPARLQALVDG